MPIISDGALIDAFNSVSNRLLGFGGRRDPLNSIDVGNGIKFSEDALTEIYRSSALIRKIIDRYPRDATALEPVIKQGDTNLNTDSILGRWRNIEVHTIGDRYRGVSSAFEEAGILARLYGNAYIVMGVDDGREFSEPVDENNIRSIRWLAVRDRVQIRPASSDRELYQLQVSIGNELPDGGRSAVRIHRSRLLKFHGHRLRGYALRRSERAYEDDPIIEALFEQFNAFTTGVRSGAGMLNSHSVFKYKLNGLARLTQQENTELLQARFMGIVRGLSSMKGLFFDAQQEDADFINRAYGGVDGLINALRDVFVSVSEMPHSMLFGSPTGGAFSESGASDRYEWASNIASYQRSEFLPNHTELLRLSCRAKDSPTGGIFPEGLSIEYPSILQLTAKEKAEVRKIHADCDAIYLDRGVLSPAEVRERFAGAEYSEEIELLQSALPSPEPTTPDEPIPSEESVIDSVEVVNNKVRINGQLLPLSEYGEPVDETDTSEKGIVVL
jgi:uncharacterized protein